MKIQIGMFKKIICFVMLMFFLELALASPPQLPTLIYGKVGYEDGQVLEGEEVTSTWYENGVVKQVSTQTLTNQEADLLGDPDWGGYYSFQIDNLPDQTTVKIASGNKVVSVTSHEGILISVDIILDEDGFVSRVVDFFSSVYSKETYEDESVEKNLRGGSNDNLDSVNGSEEEIEDVNGSGSYGGDFLGQEPAESSNSSPYDKHVNVLGKPGPDEVDPSVLESLYQFSAINKGSFILFGILFLGVILLVGFLIVILSRKSGQEDNEGVITSVLGVGAAANTKKFMNKKPLVLTSDDSLLDAIDLFVNNHLALIPIVNVGGVVGVVTKKRLLQKSSLENFDSLEKIKLKEVVEKDFVSCASKTSMADVYTMMLEHHFGGVLIMKDSKLLGIIDYFDILSVFDKMNLEIENPPILSQAMSKDVVVVDENSKLYQVLNTLLLKDSDYAIILKRGRPVGIITTKDLVSAKRNNFDFKKTLAVNVMSTNLVSKTPGTALTEALKLALERKFNQIPVVMDGNVVGVVTVKYLVKAYYELLSELNGRKMQ